MVSLKFNPFLKILQFQFIILINFLELYDCKRKIYKIYLDGTNGIRIDIILFNDINEVYNCILNDSDDILQNEIKWR